MFWNKKKPGSKYTEQDLEEIRKIVRGELREIGLRQDSTGTIYGYYKGADAPEDDSQEMKQTMVDASQYLGGGNNLLSAKIVKDKMLDNKVLTIVDATEQEFENEKKLVLNFEEIEQGLALNATRMKIIMDAFGNLTEGWPGKRVAITLTKVMFNKELVDSIQVKPVTEAHP